jgi:TPR repeat protein
VALENGGGSAGHTILFFIRQNGFKWKQVGYADSVAIVGNAALQSKGIKGDGVLDHGYLHPVEWSADSKWLTVALDATGETDDKQHVEIANWHCRYNPTSHAVELLQLNPGKIDITSTSTSGEPTPPVATTPLASTPDGDRFLAQGEALFTATATTEQLNQAFGFFMKAAELGNAAAEHRVGVAYATGKGVEKNESEAVRWYQKSADEGFAEAQCDLGVR